MTSQFATLCAALLFASVVAGCVGSDSAQEAPPRAAGPASFDENTGGIEGMVLDQETRPVPQATVAVLGSGSEPLVSTLTDADGMFSLSAVPPGKHVLAVQKLGYESASRVVEVRVGEVTAVTLAVAAISLVEPRFETFMKPGFFDCTWYYAGSSGMCGFIGPTNSTTGNPLEQFWVNSKRKWDYRVGPHVMTVFNELTWKKGTAATGDKLTVIMSHGPTRDAAHNFCRTGGLNPVIQKWQREEPSDAGACLTGTSTQATAPGPKTISWAKGETLQSFVSTGPGSGPAGDLVVGLAYQQSFQLYFSIFYEAIAPDGYSAFPDG